MHILVSKGQYILMNTHMKCAFVVLPRSDVCLPRVCTMFSFLINKQLSISRDLDNHVTVFSVFIGKSKVELCDPQREI